MPPIGPQAITAGARCVRVQVRKTRFAMHKAIDPDYYGFRDDDDGVLEPLEAEAEKVLRAQV